MPSTLKRLWCRHDLFWSERHQGERCRKCGKVMPIQTDNPKSASPPTSQLKEVLEPVLTTAPEPMPIPAPDFVDLPHSRNERPDDESPPRRRPAHVPAGTIARRNVLDSHFTRLASGEELDRLEVLDLVMGLLEDAHAHEPIIFGPAAASRFADLHQASIGESPCWSEVEPERRSA